MTIYRLKMVRRYTKKKIEENLISNVSTFRKLRSI